MTDSRNVSYLTAIKVRYGVEPEELYYLNQLKQNSRKAKHPMWTKLVGFDAPPLKEMRYMLGAPPNYGASDLGMRLLAIREIIEQTVPVIPEELRLFLFNAIHRIRDGGDNIYVDLIQNTTYGGAKASRMMAKLLKKHLGDMWWVNNKPLATLLREKYMDKKFPLDKPIDIDLFVQRFFVYASSFKVRAELSFEWDDFANCAQTNSFGSCYRVGDVQERAPFTLALSPNVACLRLVNERGGLVGRSWIAINNTAHGTGALAYFGAYNILDPELYTWVSSQMSERFGWARDSLDSVRGFIKYEGGHQADSHQELNGRMLQANEQMRLALVGDKLERDKLHIDPIIHGEYTKADMTTKKITVELPHVPCPVCGGHGPERKDQVICRECMSKLLAKDEDCFASGSYNIAEDDIYGDVSYRMAA